MVPRLPDSLPCLSLQHTHKFEELLVKVGYRIAGAASVLVLVWRDINKDGASTAASAIKAILCCSERRVPIEFVILYAAVTEATAGSNTDRIQRSASVPRQHQ